MIKNFSFRVGANESMALEHLQKSLPIKVSRDDICNAAIELFENIKDNNVFEDSKGLNPLDFCAGILYEFLKQSSMHGKTVCNIIITMKGNSVFLPAGTLLKLEGLSTVRFLPSNSITIKLEISPDLAVIYNTVIKLNSGNRIKFKAKDVVTINY